MSALLRKLSWRSSSFRGKRASKLNSETTEYTSEPTKVLDETVDETVDEWEIHRDHEAESASHLAEVARTRPCPFTPEEIAAFMKAKSLLLNKYKVSPDRIDSRRLLVTVMNCKINADEAAEKYSTWIDLVRDAIGVESLREVFEETGYYGERLKGSVYEERMKCVYNPCGVDKDGRRVIWIQPMFPPTDDVSKFEQVAIMTSLIVSEAMCADLITLRKGATVAFDVTNFRIELMGRYKHDSKMAKLHRGTPVNIGHMFIVGADSIKRAVFNAALSVAAMLTRNEWLSRVRFATLDEVREYVTDDNLPVSHGGRGGDIGSRDNLPGWVVERLANFPPFPSGF